MKYYYFNATHWDREWYESFQSYRKYLVDTFAVLQEIFAENPEFEKFTFDGQTIVLEDILAIHPEWRGRIRELVSSGKLNVGPWYVMPDEFLCSAEALIRNLLIGKKIAREFGAEPWPVGYVCDIFGHIARLPLLLKEFGLCGIVLWRGAAESMPPFSVWESPDGSRLPVLRLPPRGGYSQFTQRVRGRHDTLTVSKEEFLEKFAADREATLWFWGDGDAVLTDAFDHSMPGRETPEFLKWLREAYPQDEFVWDDYRQLFADLNARIAGLPTVRGELISPHTADGRTNFQISGTLSSRYDVKQSNDDCQSLLEQLIEPEMAARLAEGDTGDLAFLRYAWKHLVQNHAHDSICGCSIDTVHRQMLPRFDEVRELAATMTLDFINRDRERCLGVPMRNLVRAYPGISVSDTEAAPDGNYLLRVFNPAPRFFRGTLELEIKFPVVTAYPNTQAEPFGYERYNSFLLRDAEGREIPYAIRSVNRNAMRIFFREDARYYNIYRVTAEVALAPAGWTTLRVEPSPVPVRHSQTLLTGPRSAANGKIALEIAPDGTFTVTDLGTGRAFPGQNDYIFEREIGDGWHHVPPLGAPLRTGGGNVSIAVLHDSPARAEFEIVRSYELPKELRFEGTIHEQYSGIRESVETATLAIRSRVALDRSGETVEVNTTIENTVRDFRVRLAVPTGIIGGGFASQAFGFVPRPDGRNAAAAEADHFIERETIGKNFDAVIGKRDARGGLALLSAGGLHEGGMEAGRFPGAMVVTLFRSFRRTVKTDGESEGELLKTLDFHYALAPFGPETTPNDLYNAALRLRERHIAYLLRLDLAKESSAANFLTVDTRAVVSSVKPAEDGDGIVVRLLNMDDRPVPAKLTVPFASKAVRCRFDETPVGTEEALTAGTLSLEVPPLGAVSCRFSR